MENLYLEDSPLTDISRRMQNFVLGEAFVVNFGVYPMPDFDNATIRGKFEEMVQSLETMTNYGAGKENTNLWTREYSNVHFIKIIGWMMKSFAGRGILGRD